MKRCILVFALLLGAYFVKSQTLYVSGVGSVTAQNAAVNIGGNATVSSGATALVGATVSISSNFESEQDVLGINGVSSGADGSISYSYNSTTGVLTLSGAESAVNYQITLRKVTYTNTAALPSTAGRVITFSLNAALPFSGTGHYYEFVTSAGISWPDANTAANSRNYFGLQGYLVTVMSAEENAFCAAKLVGDGWMGANAAADGITWKWMTGPEAGTVFWNGVSYGTAVAGKYANWAANQPDGTAHTEDYVQFFASGGLGKWNNLPVDYDPLINGYVVEYGGMAGDPVLHISDNVVVNFAPRVRDLTVATGSTIKWYSAAAGGTLYTGAEALVHDQHYYASQTVNGVESTARLDVTANLVIQAAPAAGTHEATKTEMVWKWNTASGATGYKWSTTNLYSSATDMGTAVNKTETGLTCNVAYIRYVWAYNALGCVSAVTSLTQTTSACAAATSTFSYTGAMQTFTVPTGITTLTIEVWGAQGSTYDGGRAGIALGGYATGSLSVTQGQELNIFVGQQGLYSMGGGGSGGYNGGGNGIGYAGGGGGASDVRFGGTALSNRVIVAGGAGGYYVPLGAYGGNGGGSSGVNGISGSEGLGGSAGTQISGGTCGAPNAGSAGSFGQGGNGGGSYAGGGGGGYYGGAGGGGETTPGNGKGGGGGGGSSYIGGVTGGSTTAGQRSGNGQVKITY